MKRIACYRYTRKFYAHNLLLCVSGSGAIIGVVVPGTPVNVDGIIIDGMPTGPAPGTCSATGTVLAAIASGTVPPALSTKIGPLGVCVFLD
jgi:hypothetical protein